MRSLYKILFGAFLVFGGLTGKFVLVGTHSGLGLAAVGAVLVVFGIFRLRANIA